MAEYLVGNKQLGTLEAIEAYTNGLTGGNMDLMKIMTQVFMSNNQEEIIKNEINAIFSDVITEYPRLEGMQLPVEDFPIYFSQGKASSNAPEFRPYLDKFTLSEQDGWGVVLFDYSNDQIRKSKSLAKANNGTNPLMVQAQKAAESADMHYRNKLMPYSIIQAMLTGTTFVDTIPPLSVSVNDTYTKQFGALRGETCPEKILDTSDKTTLNMFRSIEGTTLQEKDIYRMVEEMEDFTGYMGGQKWAIAHPNVINELTQLVESGSEIKAEMGTRDIRARRIWDINFVSSNIMSKDFILFWDGDNSDLLLKGVEFDEEQRGVDLVFGTKKEHYLSLEDMADVNGNSSTKYFINPFEYYMAQRGSVGVLGLKQEVGFTEMQTGGVNEVAVNAFIQKLIKGYDFSKRS